MSILKVIDSSASGVRHTTLNDIPVGQVFRGWLNGHRTGRRFEGVFYKINGSSRLHNKSGDAVIHTDVVVVQLTGDRQGTCGLFLSCVEVHDYEPLSATLTVAPEEA